MDVQRKLEILADAAKYDASCASSGTEKRASSELMDKVEPLKAELSSVGHEIAEHLQEPAQQALQDVKTVASEGVDTVKDTAKDATQQTTETLQHAKDNITTGRTEHDTPTTANERF